MKFVAEVNKLKLIFFSKIKLHEFSNYDVMFFIFATLRGDLFKI